MLALSDHELLRAVGGKRAGEIGAAYRSFRPADGRSLLERTDCEAICLHSDRYPGALRNLDDAPNPLYLRGGVERLTRLTAEPGVAIVGGRHPSEYGREVAREMGRGLASAGVTVISGLALGIDAASHRGAILGGDSVLAVLGCGPDVRVSASPQAALPADRRSRRRARRAPAWNEARSSGASRHGIASWPRLASSIVVVEARESSGSLITADFAIELGREVAAVPGQVTARVAAGSNRLLREGSTVVRDAQDVLDTLFGAGVRPVPVRPEPTLDPPLRAVLDAIEVRDSLHHASRRAGLSAGGLRAALGRLESLGLVRSDGLGGYERCATNGRAT